ncbi:Asp23/Gls24 family envelope stress response protein [Actinacidiphila acididurans]|uniref:Asp23/Gls24 family envelope stress response protein n=1 Tax=Actinacidiphila acididurans TaxID=2784346 RepID=A0ABS2TQS0_9ACTN|nr:Asp23/Gls24 family envelope stress response protein [Actinacidiphila acididurans]MBM9505683.1 Asp23/Gls24 family envelope stress response protein [Actinacidiphila acididurans]
MAAAVPAQLPAADRGSLRIADRVVAKIAAQAAGEVLSDVPGADLVPRGTTPHASVSVRKSGTRDAARLRLTLELGYPADIGAVCGSVRRHVTDKVAALTGMDVPEVAVEVERLHSAAARRRDEGRVE